MHENAELVRRGYAAFNAGDMETLTELFHENASWHTPGSSPIAGDRHGRDDVFAQFGRYGGETAGTFKAELKWVATDDEGRVVGVHHNTAERNGKQLDTDCLHHLRDRGRPARQRSRALLRSRQLGRVLVVAPAAEPERSGPPASGPGSALVGADVGSVVAPVPALVPAR